MGFTLLPAVDVAAGRVVRAGPQEAATPLDTALRWQDLGAAWVHLVDLDAATGRGSNASLLAETVASLAVAVELAGGIVDDASLATALATGAERVNLAAEATTDTAWCERVIDEHGDRLAVCLDVRIVDGAQRIAPRGASADGGDLWEVIERLDGAGCARYVVTDVERDGRLLGPNLDLYRRVTAATATPVLASGGVSSIDDLVALAELGLEGAVVGAALHTGRLSLGAALAAVG